jgi:hypothetical protein
MSFKHLGVVKDHKEQLDGPEVEQWAGALENYTLRESGGVTTLIVDIDITDQYKDYFAQTWPKALDQVKALSENITSKANKAEQV